MNRDGTVLSLAVAAAFAAAMLAVSGHANHVEQGYRLAAVRREGEVLLREALSAERRVSVLKLPPAVAARAKNLHKLDLDYPRDRRVLTHDEVARLMVPAVPPASGLPARPVPAEVMAR